ncbi:MAG TPA: hypothetical protein VG722_13275, partial [Tepidisphaeraceae bacterium]|nr:hypothetical protein [Tepidisphaeraceae bacterium]
MKREATRFIAAASVAVLGVMSAKTTFGGTIEGPLQDMKAAPSDASQIGITISISTKFDSITDGITIIFNTADARAIGVGYVGTSSTPDDYLVTTIYGEDLSPTDTTLQPGEVGGLDSIHRGYSIDQGRGEEIFGNDGKVYQSSVNELLSYTQVSALGLDTTPFSPNSGDFFYVFETLVPKTALPGVVPT